MLRKNNIQDYTKIVLDENKPAIDELISKIQSSAPKLSDILRNNAEKEAESIAYALQNDLMF